MISFLDCFSRGTLGQPENRLTSHLFDFHADAVVRGTKAARGVALEAMVGMGHARCSPSSSSAAASSSPPGTASGSTPGARTSTPAPGARTSAQKARARTSTASTAGAASRHAPRSATIQAPRSAGAGPASAAGARTSTPAVGARTSVPGVAPSAARGARTSTSAVATAPAAAGARATPSLVRAVPVPASKRLKSNDFGFAHGHTVRLWSAPSLHSKLRNANMFGSYPYGSVSIGTADWPSADAFVVEQEHWGEKFTCSVSSLLSRILGKCLVNDVWLLSHGGSGHDPVSFMTKSEARTASTNFFVFVSKAAELKHDKMANAIQSLANLKPTNSLYSFQMLASTADIQANINNRTVNRLRWVVTQAEVSSCREALSTHLQVAASHRPVHAAVLTMGELCRSLGKSKSGE